MKSWLFALMGVMGLVGAAEGALGPVINGQVYDDVQGISWLQDTNIFITLCDAEGDIESPVNPILVSYNAMSPVRNTATVCTNGGRVYWDDGEKFIAALNANNYLGIATWRQPAVLQPDATCETLYDAANPPSYPEQRGGFNCRAVGSEFGHLYNIAPPDGLGNPNNAGTGSTGGTVGTGCAPNCWENDGPFINTGWYWYWLGAEYAPDSAYAWRHNRNGLQDIIEQASGVARVWAVHPGRPGLNPEGIETLFVPIEPCRIFDTRLVGGPFGGGTQRAFNVWGNGLAAQGGTDDCRVPPSAIAVHLNFTAVNPSGFGYLRGWPFGQDEPQATLLAFSQGPGLSNATALTICNTCQNDFYVKIHGAATDLVTEVVGYYKAVSANARASAD